MVTSDLCAPHKGCWSCSVVKHCVPKCCFMKDRHSICYIYLYNVTAFAHWHLHAYIYPSASIAGQTKLDESNAHIGKSHL